MKIFTRTILLITFIQIVEINCHGRLLDPPARSSAWRIDNRFPIFYDDNQMYCGGFQVQQQNGGKCGICGENYALPKQFEKGGTMYRGYIVKAYKQGQTIPVVVEITKNHLGYFEFMICNVDSMSSDATQDCLNRIYLKDTNSQTKTYIQNTSGMIKTLLKLPDNLYCKHCVFQWRYTAANSWGTDTATGQSCVGCGAQEQFFGCSDITINSNNGQTLQPYPETTKYQATTSRPFVSTTRKPILTTQRSTGTLNCPFGDGYFALPGTGCKSFYQCVNSGTVNQQVYTFACPSGLVFDKNLQVCNWPANVNCSV